MKLKTQVFIAALLSGVLSLTAAIALTTLLLSPVKNAQTVSQNEYPQPAVVLINDIETKVDKAIPQAVRPCLPSQTQGVALGGITKVDDYTYYLLGLGNRTPNGQTRWTTAIIVTDKIGCFSQTPKGGLEPGVSLMDYVPKKVANELALYFWKKRMGEMGGKQKLREELLDGLKPGPYTYNLQPEDIWALEALGISLPNELLSSPK